MLAADGAVSTDDMARLNKLTDLRRVLWVYPCNAGRPLDCAGSASQLVILPGALEELNDHDPTAVAEQLHVIEKYGPTHRVMLFAGDTMQVLSMLVAQAFDVVVIDWCQPQLWDEMVLPYAVLKAHRVAVIGPGEPARAKGIRRLIDHGQWHCAQGGNVSILRSPVLDWSDPREQG